MSKGLKCSASRATSSANRSPATKARSQALRPELRRQLPMFAKVDVNGDNAAPLFEHLKEEAPGLLGSKNVKWNFTKFLVTPMAR